MVNAMTSGKRFLYILLCGVMGCRGVGELGGRQHERHGLVTQRHYTCEETRWNLEPEQKRRAVEPEQIRGIVESEWKSQESHERRPTQLPRKAM